MKGLKTVCLVMLASGLVANAFGFSRGSVPEHIQNKYRTKVADVSTGSSEEVDSGEAESVDCAEVTEKSVSFMHLATIMLGDVDINFTDGDQEQVGVAVSNYITNCLELRATHVIKDNTVYFKFFNEKHSYADYEACMKKEGVLKEEGGKLEIDWEKATIGKKILKFNIDEKDWDKTRPLTAVFQSPDPARDGFPFTKGSEKTMGCYRNEHVVKKKGDPAFYIHDEVAAGEAAAKCTKCELAAIERSLRSLQQEVEMDDSVKAVIEELLKKKNEIIKAEAKKLQDEMIVKLREIRQEKDEENLEALAEQYLELVRKVDDLILDPAMAQIEKLYKELAKKGRKEQRPIIKEINALKSIIRPFSNRYITKDIATKFADHALTAEAEEVEEMRLKAEAYSKKETKSAKSTTKYVEKNLKSRMKEFEKSEDKYYADKGYEDTGKKYSAKAKQDMVVRDKLWENFQQKYQEGQMACQPYFMSQRDPQKCQEWQQKGAVWQQQALQQRAYFNKRIGSNMGYSSSLSASYQKALVAEGYDEDSEVDYPTFDMSYSSGGSQGVYMPQQMNPGAYQMGAGTMGMNPQMSTMGMNPNMMYQQNPNMGYMGNQTAGMYPGYPGYGGGAGAGGGFNFGYQLPSIQMQYGAGYTGGMYNPGMMYGY